MEIEVERLQRRVVSVHNLSWQGRCPLIAVYSYSSTCAIFCLIFYISHSICLLMDPSLTLAINLLLSVLFQYEETMAKFDPHFL